MLTIDQLRQKYLDFFTKRQHKIILPESLVQTDDIITSLFTVAGMQQLVPFLKGKKHPMGNRLVNVQPCLRVEDIDIIGDSYHTTFFEMLGNWSLGDYSKEEQISWFYEFLTQELNLNPDKLYVSVFSGNKNIPQDKESIRVWQNIFKTSALPSKKDSFDPSIKIYSYGPDKNWWSRSGSPQKMPLGEIGGPDSEVFYDFGPELKLHEKSPYKNKPCHLNCDCGRFLEIGNSVFIEYQKEKDGSLSLLNQKNVDFGGGLERILAATENQPDIFKTSIFIPLIKQLEKETGKKYSENQPDMRIIVDHLRAVTLLMSEGLEPSNKQQGYVLRRLFRRAMIKLNLLSPHTEADKVFKEICQQIFLKYKNIYTPLVSISHIKSSIEAETNRFKKSLERGLKEFNKNDTSKLNAQFAFDLYQTYGFPVEITQELFQQKKQKLDLDEFEKIKQQHQEKSRLTSAGMFKGGMADNQEKTIKLHTATHLLHQTLRDILGDSVAQSGSNITPERARFDFTHDQALTKEQLQQVEKIINKQIQLKLPVVSVTLPYKEAVNQGALAFFKHKYPEKVTVYSVGDFSKEICGGPHVKNTAEIGNIKIYKQKSLGQGVRRLYLKIT